MTSQYAREFWKMRAPDWLLAHMSPNPSTNIQKKPHPGCEKLYLLSERHTVHVSSAA